VERIVFGNQKEILEALILLKKWSNSITKKRNIHQNDNVNYTLHAFKKNAGFTKVRKWEIILPNKNYSLEFGDQTSDAHKNARKITLTFEPNEVGKNEVEIIHLGKR
jgi:hypothetical protein